MRGQSHRSLGIYLAQKYMNGIPEPCIRAFLFGCIQPDRNPVTYLKGSIRAQWLRGHNYRNAHRFMKRIACRLEKKKVWSLFDYYTLGKLIHYTADAFTFAHNDSFPDSLSDHREYEHSLQEYFLQYLHMDPPVDIPIDNTIAESIERCHREYSRTAATIHRDASYALRGCCCVFAILFFKPTPIKNGI